MFILRRRKSKNSIKKKQNKKCHQCSKGGLQEPHTLCPCWAFNGAAECTWCILLLMPLSTLKYSRQRGWPDFIAFGNKPNACLSCSLYLFRNWPKPSQPSQPLFNRPGVAGAVLQTALSLSKVRYGLWKYIQNNVSPKPEELESWSFERMFIPHYVSCVTCHESHVTCHLSHVFFFKLFFLSFFL